MIFVVGGWTGQTDPVVSQAPVVTTPVIGEALKNEVPTINKAEAKDFRSSNYAFVDSIEKVLDLPINCWQTEALHAADC